MQNSRVKRRRQCSTPQDVVSSSNSVFDAACQTRLQSLRRASVLRSSARGDSRQSEPVFTEHNISSAATTNNDGHTVISPDYVDLGRCNEVCEFCGALFWFAVRLTSFPLGRRPRYHRCCRAGRVVLQYPLEPPTLLKSLFSDPAFQSSIRAYNSMFSMTSFGATVDASINQSMGPYVFRVSGQVCHWIGSICPQPGDRPRFLQMYVLDSENEISNRLQCFSNEGASTMPTVVVSTLIAMFDDTNGYVKLFRTARDFCDQAVIPDFSIRLFSRAVDRRYDNPVPGVIGAIIHDLAIASKDFDIIVYGKDNNPHRVSKLHPAYMPLQYPVLFPYGEQGWSPELQIPTGDTTDSRNLTPSMFYSYQFHDRLGVYTHLLHAGRLFQQYIVDAYICVEHSRLEYIRNNQQEFHCEFLDGVHDAICQGDTEGRSVGKRVVLPSSFTGGPRYMYKHYQDALALCRVYGNTQYFVTFTCNVKWPEISREIIVAGVSCAQDRPDIIARVFQMKVCAFIKHISAVKPFGDVAAELYTVEFQKRGLPHCHILIWVTETYRIHNAEDVDRYISAELPDPDTDPILYRIVTGFMLHGPCGLLRPNSPCMKDGFCTKKFPKPYELQTTMDAGGYVRYKRQNISHQYMRRGVPLDNGFVVPYNRNLLLHFDAHINVEYCGWSMLIKYLFKYISKGADRVRFALINNQSADDTNVNNTSAVVDEIKNYVDGRFVCPHEASWRIFAFPIHHRNPPVQTLAVHLEGKQNITFRQSQHLQDIVNSENTVKTTLTEWLSNNNIEKQLQATSSNNGLDIRYIDYLSKYKWDVALKSWIRRTSKRTPTVGRLAYIHPTCGELFYLRLLLGYQKGCSSFADIRTVCGQAFSTYRQACEKLGLIGNDKEWSTTIAEASEWATSKEIRLLFVHILLFCDVTNPTLLWESTWKNMSEDFTYNINSALHVSNRSLNDDDLKQYVLYELELLLNSNSSPMSLKDFGLPLPTENVMSTLRNVLLLEERSYDREAMHREHLVLKTNLQNEQRAVYDRVIASIETSSQLLLFVYGHGGSGKTYLWKTIIVALRSVGRIVLAVAASGIASLLLPSGRTAHSRFKIPLELNDESVCNIKKNTNLSKLLLETSLIIWDEAPMSDRRCFESLDKTLRDMTNRIATPFGGKSVLLGGDFRQTLPVKPRATKEEIIGSCLPRSYLW